MHQVRILVVDDDRDAGMLVKTALLDAHFEQLIDVVPTASEGMERIRADEHDVYLVDYRLPDGTGTALIHEAKAEGIDRPFILITGYGSGDLDEAALTEGAADYIEKHLLGTYLERAIRYALRDWRSSRALREHEEQLRHAQRKALGRLAGSVAHDFKALLTAITGFTDAAFRQVDSHSRVADDLRQIQNAAERAVAITGQLLAFSRKQFLNPAAINLNESVAAVARTLPPLLGDRIELTIHLASHVEAVWADATQMDQLLLNLAMNARDAMPTGGQLTIETASVELDGESLRMQSLATNSGRYVMLAVVDTGIGMDAETRARAFDPFFTTKPPGQGTGLGLAVVHSIVEHCGGRIALDTAPGRGTAIRIYLPAHSPARGEDDLELPPVRPRAGEPVLLVDADDADRRGVAEALQRLGFTVHEARTAEEATEWALESPVKPHLLVTEIGLPHITGPELAGCLLQEYPDMRVLYMVRHTPGVALIRNNLWHGVPVLQKPFTGADLAERVRVALNGPTQPA